MQDANRKPGSSIRWGEVFGVLAVIFVILWLILAPAFRSAKRASASAREQEYVRAADIALIRYMADHAERFPNLSGDMVALLRPYLNDPKVIEAMNHFVWNDKLSGVNQDDLSNNPEELWVVYSKVQWSGSYVVGTADGHVKKWAHESLPQALKKGVPVLQKSK